MFQVELRVFFFLKTVEYDLVVRIHCAGRSFTQQTPSQVRCANVRTSRNVRTNM